MAIFQKILIILIIVLSLKTQVKRDIMSAFTKRHLILCKKEGEQ